jgi:hypothetical protein
MNEMDLLTRMRDNAPHRVSPRAAQMYHAALRESLYPKRRVARLPARRLALAGLPALAIGAAAAVLVAVVPSGAHPARPAAAPLTVQLLADRAAAAAMSEPDVQPGQWVYEKWILVNQVTHRQGIAEKWATADGSREARYINDKLDVTSIAGNTTSAQFAAPPYNFIDDLVGYGAIVQELPAGTGALIRRLGELGAELPGPIAGCAESAVYCDAFEEITQLVGDYLLPGAVAADLFRALADIPGVSAAVNVPAGGGQRGDAFRLRLTTGYQELILNPVTYQPLPAVGESGVIERELVSGPGVRPSSNRGAGPDAASSAPVYGPSRATVYWFSGSE